MMPGFNSSIGIIKRNGWNSSTFSKMSFNSSIGIIKSRRRYSAHTLEYKFQFLNRYHQKYVISICSLQISLFQFLNRYHQKGSGESEVPNWRLSFNSSIGIIKSRDDGGDDVTGICFNSSIGIIKRWLDYVETGVMEVSIPQ